MIRRAAALIAGCLLLQLNVLGVERACGPRHETAAGTASHAHHSGRPQVPPPTQSQSQSKCCDALSACGMSLALNAEHAVTVSFAPAAIAAKPGDAEYEMPRRAPDPPPPRTQAQRA